MSFITFAERLGMRACLQAVLEARFGPEGAALMEQLGERTDRARLKALAQAATTGPSLDALRPLFNGVELERLEGMRQGLRTVMEVRFGADGAALVDQLDKGADEARLEGLTRAAVTASTLDELRPLFNGPAPGPSTVP